MKIASCLLSASVSNVSFLVFYQLYVGRKLTGRVFFFFRIDKIGILKVALFSENF